MNVCLTLGVLSPTKFLQGTVVVYIVFRKSQQQNICRHKRITNKGPDSDTKQIWQIFTQCVEILVTHLCLSDLQIGTEREVIRIHHDNNSTVITWTSRGYKCKKNRITGCTTHTETCQFINRNTIWTCKCC